MTTPAVERIGYCAHESREGDWAFALALETARRLDVPLNVFGFVLDPYQRDKHEKSDVQALAQSDLVRLEKELRFRYDEAAGEYVNVGFRLCGNGAWYELHRCLCRREFQLLVLARPTEDACFLGAPVEEFLESFVCPTVLVGPGSDTRIQLNRAARMLQNQLALPAAVACH